MKTVKESTLQVKDIMTPHPIAVEVTASVHEAADAMFSADIRHIPVVRNGELVGILSDRDIRSFSYPIEERLLNPEDADDQMDTEVGSLVQIDVISVQPENSVREVIDLMLDQKIGAVPVTSSEEGKLVGIVSYIDVLKSARDYL